MKKATKIQIGFVIVLFFILWLFTSCKTKTVYVPVEKTKTEYIDKVKYDSIYKYDSVYLYSRKDTVFLNKYQSYVKYSLIRDSVYITDSIQVPYPVVEYQEVNRLTSFQSFEVWCGRILLFLIIAYLLFRYIKRKVKGKD